MFIDTEVRSLILPLYWMRASLARFNGHSFGKFAPAWATLPPIEAKVRDTAMKILKTALVLVAVVAIGGALVAWFWFQGQREPFTGAALERDLALQDESAVVIPPQRLERLSDSAPQPNANRNLYFGELHLHTDQSFDAVLFGNRLTIDDAYRFARGEKLLSGGMEVMQLSAAPGFRRHHRPRRGLWIPPPLRAERPAPETTVELLGFPHTQHGDLQVPAQIR